MALTRLPTSAITSGTFDNARISAGSVTQHVTATDLQPIKSDISALALSEATNESSAAFNLPNQFIETFTDDTNLGTQTDGDRSSGYWGTVSFGTAAYETGNQTGNYTVTATHGALTNGSMSFTNWINGDTTTNDVSNSWVCDASTVAGEYIKMDLGSGNSKNYVGAKFYNSDTTGAYPNGVWKWQGSNDDSDWTDLSANFTWQTAGNPGILEVAWSSTDLYRYIRVLGVSGSTGSNTWEREVQFKVSPVTANATGTLIQSANTVASAKTKVGGTMLYKDAAGTATLGTDLKIYFSCNNGGAWTEAASYNAITPVYSTGVKQVRLGETTCTSGTGIIYKAVWANQSAGSKETQLHGIGTTY